MEKYAENIMSVAVMYRAGLFENEEQARGAFSLAYQQGIDGICNSGAAEWMGLTNEEYGAWVSGDVLPDR